MLTPVLSDYMECVKYKSEKVFACVFVFSCKWQGGRWGELDKFRRKIYSIGFGGRLELGCQGGVG